MLSLNHTYKSNEALLFWLESNVMSFQKKSIMIQILDATLNKEQIVKLTKILKNFLPEAVIVGSSTCGIISNGELEDYVTHINISIFEATLLESFLSIKDDSYMSGKNMALSLIKNDTQCVFLFIDSLFYNSDEFLQGFNEFGGKDVILVGGGAGDNFLFEEPFVMFDTKIYHNAVIGVALNNKNLRCTTAYNHGWNGVGKLMKVSKSKGNCVYEINNEPIISIYAKYLGEDIIKSMPASLLEFPLIFTQDGVQRVKTVYALSPDGGLCFDTPIKEGTAVRFGMGDENLILNNIADNYVKFSLKPVEAMFIYTSASRKIFFDKELECEYTALATLSPHVGFISYGEYTKITDQNKYLNTTSVILGLSESEKIENKLQTALFHPSYRKKSASAIAHLIDVTTKELHEEINVKHTLVNILTQYKYALDTATLVSKTNPRGIITYVNENFAKLSGYTENELLGKSHKLIRHPAMSNKVFQTLWKDLKKKETWSGMLQNRHKNGTSYYMYATIFPILNESNEITEYMAICDDLTNMIEYEKSLEKEKKRLYQILDNQSSIVALTTENGYVNYLNKKFFDYFKFKNLEEFLSKYNCICDLYVDKNGRQIGCGDSCNTYELYHQNNQNEKVYILDKKKNILFFTVDTKKINFDNKIMYLSTLTDITKIEKAKILAEDAVQAKSDFIANMSHEIRTPLHGIIGFVDLLEETNLNEQQQKYMNIIKNSASMLLGTVNEILDFSKIEKGEMKTELIEANLYVIIEQIYENFSFHANEKNLSYQLNIEAGVDECLYIDVLHLQQIVSNLINNAIKFTPENGSVIICISVTEDNTKFQILNFSVKDTGIGISKNRQEKIFESFLQEDTSTTRKFGGTGLGLSISSSLVTLMGSEKIELKSKKGKGSEFFFDMKFDKGLNEKFKLKTLLKNSVVQLIHKGEKSFEIIEYFKSFDIETITLKDVNTYSKNSMVIILCDLDEALSLHKILEDNNHLILCLVENSNFISNYMNLKVISSYKDCLSKIYNAISLYFTQKQESFLENISFKGMHMLIAEDNEVNQILIKEMLHKFEIKSTIVENGEEALNLAKLIKYDLIFMDINMPIMGGKEAVKYILENSLNMTTPIVAMTSNILKENIQEYKKLGMITYLGKPFQYYDMAFLLSKLLTHSSSRGFHENEITENLAKATMLLELPKTVMKRLYEKFITTMEEILKEMYQADKLKDYKYLGEQAHKLKGASSSMCFEKITDISIRLENKIKTHECKNCSYDIVELSNLFKDLEKYSIQRDAYVS